jgi:hypothetical protein
MLGNSMTSETGYPSEFLQVGASYKGNCSINRYSGPQKPQEPGGACARLADAFMQATRAFSPKLFHASKSPSFVIRSSTVPHRQHPLEEL